ncbi:MAG: glycosyltransferase family 4 protein [Thiothrix sp.]|nr:MAG: glycosyltransferase family 4 protein [Thiothrix sp.]
MIANKKIAFVIHSLGRGGAEKVVSELSIYWRNKGYSVTLILFENEVGYPIGGELINLNLPSGDGFFERVFILLKRAWHLKKVYAKQQFDLIIAVMETASFPSIMVNSQTIASNHCNPSLYFSQAEWKLAASLFPKAKKVVCVSEIAKQAFQSRLPSETPLTTIYNPVDFVSLADFSTKSPSIKIEEKYIIAVGRLEPQKRIDRLLNAYADSKLSHEAKLLILGEGSLRPQLEQQIKNLGLVGQVLMPGNIENPHPNIARAEFLVLASDHEGFPMVLIEALAIGKPVVSTDCATGPNEIIQHGQNGLLVPVENTLALRDALDELYFNQPLHQYLSHNAAASVRHLSVDTIAAQWEALAWKP